MRGQKPTENTKGDRAAAAAAAESPTLWQHARTHSQTVRFRKFETRQTGKNAVSKKRKQQEKKNKKIIKEGVADVRGGLSSCTAKEKQGKPSGIEPLAAVRLQIHRQREEEEMPVQLQLQQLFDCSERRRKKGVPKPSWFESPYEGLPACLNTVFLYSTSSVVQVVLLKMIRFESTLSGRAHALATAHTHAPTATAVRLAICQRTRLLYGN